MQPMEANQKYFVFISYSSLDNEWAIWLRDELEHHHLPASFNGRTDVRNNLRKVFRDVKVKRDEIAVVDGCLALVDNDFGSEMKGWALVRVMGKNYSTQSIVTHYNVLEDTPPMRDWKSLQRAMAG